MSKMFFRYKIHPGDLLRNSDYMELPNPYKNLEDFLIWFLDNYQSDKRIARIDDLSRIADDEFIEEYEKSNINAFDFDKSKAELLAEIKLIENELKAEAFKNFYHLLLSQKIEILEH
jgi:hypothetical protein